MTTTARAPHRRRGHQLDAPPAIVLDEVTPYVDVKGERLVVLRPHGWARDWRAESDPYESATGWRIRVLPEAAWYVLCSDGLLPPDVRIEDVPLMHVRVETLEASGGLW